MSKEVSSADIERVKAKREPDGRERKAMDRAAERFRTRADPLVFEEQDSSFGMISPMGKHNDTAGHVLMFLDTFGTASAHFAERSAMQLVSVMRSRGETTPSDTALNAGLGAVSGIAPENEIEAMLAVQMTGTHEVAMEMLTRAKLADTPEQLERYGALATKLLRTFTAQTEALAKMRRGGAQKVTVEHVHVYQGGQAIVGNVTTQSAPPQQGGGGHFENEHQAHALTGPAALAFQADPSMLCPDAGRDPVPLASGERKNAVPNARRRQGKRRAEG